MTTELTHLTVQRSQQSGFIRFSTDYIEESSEGDIVEHDALMVLLPALVRAGDNCGDALGGGELRRFLSWQGGEGVELVREESGFLYRRLRGVSSWADFHNGDEGVRNPVGFEGTSQVGAPWRIHAALSYLPGMLWYGMRDGRTNQWEQSQGESAPERAAIQRAIMVTLQLDVLLKGQDMPRGRVRMDFEEYQFWMWTSPDENYLMYWGRCLGEQQDLVRIAAAGEAFLLGS